MRKARGTVWRVRPRRARRARPDGDRLRELVDKVAVITGAASGIGRGMAERFARAGMKVVLADVEAAALERTTQDLRAAGAELLPVVTDVSRPDSVAALAEA